ncbi:hypothetical protein OROMI_027368 [Orobanche minor]
MVAPTRKAMKNPIDRYQTLKLKEALSIPSQYLFACKELSFILKNAYSKSPKNLQSLIFQETLFAFSLLPQIQTQSAISAANSLLQSAELVLPKQKRALAVTEHKHAVVVSKRKSKTNQKEQRQDDRLVSESSTLIGDTVRIVVLLFGQAIVEFILGTRQLSDDSSSDSDSDTDTEDEHVCKLWSYPRRLI